MKRLKTFLLYALMIAAFWFLSDFLIYMAIHGSYQPIEAQVIASSPQINVGESKATFVNGYVKGNVYNDSGDTIQEKYIKMDFYSPRNFLLGTKYVKIENLEEKKTQDFEMWFRLQEVRYVKVDIVDNIGDSTEDQFISEEKQFYLVLGAVAILYFL